MASKRPGLGPVSSSRRSKVVERLRKRVEDGEYYEALQTYKALYSRYRAGGKDQEALDLIFQGALTLLGHDQFECGTDLALMFINFHKEKKTPITNETLNSIAHIFHLYSNPPNVARGADSIALRLKDLAEVTSREQFIRAALKWSSMVGDRVRDKYGSPQLHQLMARQYWIEKQYPLSADHFLHAEDPRKFAEMLIEFSTMYGYPAEKDLFIVRAVLQLIILEHPKTAITVYRDYVVTHPYLTHLVDRPPPYDGEPSLNFAWFLIYSAAFLDDFTVNVFNWIKTNYKPVIDRDPTFSEYMDKIGQVYCGLQPAGDQSDGGPMDLQGMLGSLVSSLTGPPTAGVESGATTIITEEPNKTLLASDDVLD